MDSTGPTASLAPVEDRSGVRPWTIDDAPAAIFSLILAFFCVWTLGTNVVALAALPFRWLHLVAVLALCAAALAVLGSRRIDDLFRPGRLTLPRVLFVSSNYTSNSRSFIITTLGVGLLFGAAAAAQYKGSHFLPLWLLCLSISALALYSSGSARSLAQFTTAYPSQHRVPIVLGTLIVIVVMLTFYYLTSLPDADDSLYLNFAVGALRSHDGVFAYDTMLGVPGLSFIKSTYRLESYQLLAALIADITTLPVIVVAHSVIPAIALVFTGTALVLLHRTLFAQQWHIGVTAHLLCLLILDGTLQSYGDHAIPRFFQGKAPFVTIMVPLIAVLTVSALRDRRWLAVGVMAAAMVVSVGFTANAVFVAPLAAALVAGPMFVFGNRERRIACLRLLLTIVYPATLVAYLLIFDPPKPSEIQDVGSIGATLWAVFGSPLHVAGAIVLLFLSAAAALLDRRLRHISLYTLLLVAVVLNPFLWTLYGRYVTGNVNFRLLWAVPLPFVLAIIITIVWRAVPSIWSWILGAALVGATALPGSVLHLVRWGPTLRKVPQPEYQVARRVNALAPVGGLILAPEEIAAWIPTLDNSRPVVEARAIYLPQRVGELPPGNLAQRKILFGWITAKIASASPAAVKALQALNVQLVVVRNDTGSAVIIKTIQTIPGYRYIDHVGRYVVYAHLPGHSPGM